MQATTSSTQSPRISYASKVKTSIDSVGCSPPSSGEDGHSTASSSCGINHQFYNHISNSNDFVQSDVSQQITSTNHEKENSKIESSLEKCQKMNEELFVVDNNDSTTCLETSTEKEPTNQTNLNIQTEVNDNFEFRSKLSFFVDETSSFDCVENLLSTEKCSEQKTKKFLNFVPIHLPPPKYNRRLVDGKVTNKYNDPGNFNLLAAAQLLHKAFYQTLENCTIHYE